MRTKLIDMKELFLLQIEIIDPGTLSGRRGLHDWYLVLDYMKFVDFLEVIPINGESDRQREFPGMVKKCPKE